VLEAPCKAKSAPAIKRKIRMSHFQSEIIRVFCLD